MQYWERLEGYKYGDDEYGILAYFGHEPTPADLARCFEGTSVAAWGNILRGKPAGGIYAEIISGIKRYGLEDFIGGPDDWRERIKNKSLRHLRKGRRARERAEKERKRLPYSEPVF